MSTMDSLKKFIGTRHGKLVVLRCANEEETSSRYRHGALVCRCDCGREVIRNRKELKNPKTARCGICKGTIVPDHTWERFTHLVALRHLIRENTNHVWWLCACACGSVLPIKAIDLKRNTKSCGCHAHDLFRKRHSDYQEKMIGRRNGRLIIEERLAEKSGQFSVWLCKCDCGNKVKVATPSIKRRRYCSRQCPLQVKNMLARIKDFASPIRKPLALEYLPKSGNNPVA